jgi:hypothetical protein
MTLTTSQLRRFCQLLILKYTILTQGERKSGNVAEKKGVNTKEEEVENAECPG